jgi:hypothetical protein
MDGHQTTMVRVFRGGAMAEVSDIYATQWPTTMTWAEPTDFAMINMLDYVLLAIAVVVGALLLFLASRNFYRARLLKYKGVSHLKATEIPLDTSTLTRLLALNLLALLIAVPLAVQVRGIFGSRGAFEGPLGVFGFIGVYALALGGASLALWAWKLLVRQQRSRALDSE